jgi:hypothetical protein
LLKSQVASAERLARVCGDSILEGNELPRLMYLKTFWNTSEPGLLAYVALLDAQGRVLMHSDFLEGKFSRQNQTADTSALRAAMRSAELLCQEAAGSRTLSLPVGQAGKRLGTVVVAYDQFVLKRSGLGLQPALRRTLVPDFDASDQPADAGSAQDRIRGARLPRPSG